ncbi:transposase [Thermoanaerobacter kivui]|uniref:Transposase n=1 Tax=Thermoanaerobacter kivui TaxID=2325 RepID=A0A097ANR5_THEKI|nr:transposase [Thermoanaerobacter kivui]
MTLHIKMKQKPHICSRCGEITSKIDILNDRKQENLTEYFKRFKDRNKVKWVIIDMILIL